MPLRAPRGFIDETDAKVSKVGHPAPPWMSSYADLMTELVCFFVILYALSAALNKNVQNAAQQVKDMIEKGQMKGEAKIDKEGLKISIEEQGGASFFGTGDAEPTPEIDGKMALLVPTLRKLAVDHEILIEGHTDAKPIHNMYFDSNWELSTARATSVTRLLIEKYGLPADHMGAVGYGATRPIAPSDTPEHAAQNRRIVIFVKSGTTKPAPKPAGAAEGASPPAAGAAPPSEAGAATAAAVVPAAPPPEPVPTPGPVANTVPVEPAPAGGR